MDETLYKVSYLNAPNGTVQVWRIWTDFDGTDYHLYAEAGQEGGKLRTTNHGKFQTLDDAEYILPSVHFVGEFAYRHFDQLERPNLNEISPGYYSEYKIRK